jgi:hypothetical protein
MAETQLNMYAGKGPKATIKYEYSAPEDVMVVPNSAYDKAPGSRLIRRSRKGFF